MLQSSTGYSHLQSSVLFSPAANIQSQLAGCNPVSLETLTAEITNLKVGNVEKEIKLKEIKIISEENDKLRLENEKLDKDNTILKKRLTSIEKKSMNIQSYKCDKCKFKSEDRNKKEKHTTDNHSEIEKEYYIEQDMIAVEICFICDKVFYSKEDLDN